MNTVLFRADASDALGGGHWARCGALATALRHRGFRTLLAARPPTNGLTPSPPCGMEIHWLKSSERNPLADAEECVALVETTGAGHIVVDHYGLDCMWESWVRRACPDARMIALEDLPNRHHNAHLLLAPAGSEVGEEFRPWLAPDTCYLGGPTFALLRPEFALVRPEALIRRTSAPMKTKALTVLIAMGATDPDGLSLDALAGARASGVAGSITVVLGSASPVINRVHSAVTADPEARLIVDEMEMAALMTLCDLGIGAAGGTSWERCAVGLPALAVCVSTNQAEVAARLDKTSAALVVQGPRPSVQEYADGLRALAEPSTRLGISRNAAALCDGAGAQRVAEHLLTTLANPK